MAWNANSGDYGMSSYGGGGGFMAGQDSSQPSSAKKSSAEKCLVPVTIKQILGCTQDVADDAIKIDGREASQITFVAQIVNFAESSTFMTYTLEDGTGQTNVNFWIEQDESEHMVQTRMGWQPGCYVRIVGQVRGSKDKFNVVAFHIRLVEDFNEITYHFLDACQAHLLHTRGQPAEPAARMPAKMAPAPAAFGGAISAAPAAAAAPAAGGAVESTHDLIYRAFSGCDQTVDVQGWSVDRLIREVQSLSGRTLSHEEIRRHLEKLSGDGQIYSTIDEDHYAPTF